MTIVQARKRAEELRSVIRYHDKKYYNDSQPEITDPEYDKLIKELLDLEKEFPLILTPDSPTQRVGGQPLKEFKLVAHFKPMLSLDNSYSPEEIIAFDERIRKNLKEAAEYVVEPKIDGVAVNIYYEDGSFVRGSTRGDGINGDDITQNIMTIKDFPFKTGIKGRFEIRGEVYITKEIFMGMNKEKEAKNEPLFVNPRNAASGSLKLLDPKQVAARHLKLFVHTLGFTDSILWRTHSEMLQELKKNGFSVVENAKLCSNIEKVLEYCRQCEERRDTLKYEIDGVVIKVNSYEHCEILGNTNKSPRYAIAFKFKARQISTLLKNIKLQVGRTGIITPVAELEPVFLAGSTISRATLHNEDEIKRKDIRIGDTVIIEKAGEVIPKVLKVVESKRKGTEKNFKMPDICPVCSSKIIRLPEEAAWRCQNVSCKAQVEGRIEHFAERKAMNIEGLGIATAAQLAAEGLVKDYSDLYSLKKDDLAGLEGFGDRSAENLINSISKSKKKPLSRLLYALGISDIGEHTAEILASKYQDLKSIIDSSKEDIENTKGIGPKAAESIMNFFGQKENMRVCRKLESSGVNMTRLPEETAMEGTLKDKSFVLTGELESFTRDDAVREIKKKGGTASNSVSKKTDFVVTGRNPGSKYDKAKKLGVKIINEEEFREMIK